MTHYSCKNCGSHLGIDWGSCEGCTPKEYLDLSKKLRIESNKLRKSLEAKIIADYRDYINAYIRSELKEYYLKLKEIEDAR